MQIKGIAHRGYPVKYPENTLSSFQAACDLSYTYVELDIQLSKDGVPVVMHDYTVDRMTDGTGMVRDFTLAELKGLRVKEQETVPTLEEVLLLLKGKLNIMVELKQAGDLYPGLEEKTLELLRKTNTFDQAIIISFDHFSIARTRKLDQDVRLGLTSSCSMPYVFPFMAENRCELLGVPIRMMTAEYSQMIEERGIIVGPWPVDSIADMELIAAQYPTSLITTNELERWSKFYQSRSELHRGH
ncbi:glycerophosphodiester phosphodiesterase [Paenibacillus thalictri]|uniref:Glycerophosphodiester phosphodiesterase n=1 Tax=Paenibacillus thalictri TaxID=2527873 RepID=A0A4Q9DL26_9BACL|nr:glycerophosphodiester phosphodiesterase family protein [Paenibacillus thalictri]TBL73957.1 glycerophosphodiester phosphodiesterase [Paenibacillus thalictri]